MCCYFENQDSAAVNHDSAARADSRAERATLITARESICERNTVSYRSLHKPKAKISVATSGLKKLWTEMRPSSQAARDFRLSARAHSQRRTAVVELWQ